MHRRFSLPVLAAVAITSLGMLANPSGALAKGGGGSVRVATISFYAQGSYDYSHCGATGPASTTFSSGVGRIYVHIRYASFRGAHLDQGLWYTPAGSLYFQSPAQRHSGHGPSVECGYITLSPAAATSLAGRWKYRLILDHTAYAAGAFVVQ